MSDGRTGSLGSIVVGGGSSARGGCPATERNDLGSAAGAASSAPFSVVLVNSSGWLASAEPAGSAASERSGGRMPNDGPAPASHDRALEATRGASVATAGEAAGVSEADGVES